MIIFDEMQNKSLGDVSILLDKSEASQLLSYLKGMIASNAPDEHFHLNNEDYSKEITVSLYDKNGSLEGFAEKYKKLIQSEG